MLDGFYDLAGFSLDIPFRYTTDVEVGGDGWIAHASYPIHENPLVTNIWDLSKDKKKSSINSGKNSVVYHEIGNNFQDRRWTPGRFTEVTVDFF